MSKNKLRQFQWFQMETRVRQMVQQLITPFSKRLFEALSNVNSLKLFSTEEAAKMEQLRKIVTEDPSHKQLNIFKEIDLKHDLLETNVCELKNIVVEAERVVDKRLEIQDQRLEESKGILLNNMKLKERVSVQVSQQNESIQQFRLQVEKMIGDARISLDKVIKDQQDDNKAHRLTSQKLSDRIQVLEEYSKTSQESFQRNTKQHLSFNSMIIHCEEEQAKNERQIKRINENLIYIKRLGNYIQQLEEKIEKQDFALQHLSPLVTQAQLSEALYSILPAKQRRRLVVYEYQKFDSLNRHILDSDPKKAKDLFNGLGVLEKVQKRNTKEIIDMKRKKLISMGIDIDNLNYEAKEKYYREVELHEEEAEDEDEVKSDNHQDHTDHSSTLNKMMELISSEFDQKMSQQMQENREYFEQIEEQLQMNLQTMLQNLDKTQQATEKQNVELLLYNKTLKEKLEQTNEAQKGMQSSLDNVNTQLRTVTKFCTLINHLQIQDELDKQSISLFGFRQNFAEDFMVESKNQKGRSPVVNLQKECFSCNGCSATTIGAFKMACLAYSPSGIVLDNKEYRREELLEISTRILQHLKQDFQQPRDSLEQTIKKKLPTSTSTQPNETIPRPQKLGLTASRRFSSTLPTQIRSRTKSKLMRVQPQVKKNQQVLLATGFFNEGRKRHSTHLGDSLRQQPD